MTHRILVVCTANVCRSPVLEAMLAHRLDPARFQVGSAGVRAPEGRQVDPDSAAQLVARGIAVPTRGARQLTRELVADADLVLTATRAHRSEVLDLDPRALRRTFTAVEFGALSTSVEAADLAGLVAEAAANRSKGPDDADLVDPIGLPLEVHAAVASRIESAVEQIVAGFGRIDEPATPQD